jgi:hypothetical protein
MTFSNFKALVSNYLRQIVRSRFICVEFWSAYVKDRVNAPWGLEAQSKVRLAKSRNAEENSVVLDLLGIYREIKEYM